MYTALRAGVLGGAVTAMQKNPKASTRVRDAYGRTGIVVLMKMLGFFRRMLICLVCSFACFCLFVCLALHMLCADSQRPYACDVDAGQWLYARCRDEGRRDARNDVLYLRQRRQPAVPSLTRGLLYSQ